MLITRIGWALAGIGGIFVLPDVISKLKMTKGLTVILAFIGLISFVGAFGCFGAYSINDLRAKNLLEQSSSAIVNGGDYATLESQQRSAHDLAMQMGDNAYVCLVLAFVTIFMLISLQKINTEEKARQKLGKLGAALFVVGTLLQFPTGP